MTHTHRKCTYKTTYQRIIIQKNDKRRPAVVNLLRRLGLRMFSLMKKHLVAMTESLNALVTLVSD